MAAAIASRKFFIQIPLYFVPGRISTGYAIRTFKLPVIPCAGVAVTAR
jgi:hypothetical protein